MKIAILFSKFFQNKHQNASIVKRFQKCHHRKYPIASVYLKYFFFFYRKIIIFEIFERQNLIQKFTKTLQVTPFLKKIIGGAYPEPLAKRMASRCVSKSEKKYSRHPLQILATPLQLRRFHKHAINNVQHIITELLCNFIV